MTAETRGQPTLGELMARFLNRQAEAQAQGVAAFDPEAEVTPYETGPVQPLDPKQAWEETLAITQQYEADARTWTAPPHWPQLVANFEPVVALPFALGHFPQMVRNFHQVVLHLDKKTLPPMRARQPHLPALLSWSQEWVKNRGFPEVLLAIGALRLAGYWEEAERNLNALEAKIPPQGKTAWSNERATLRWQQGKREEAREIWKSLDPTPAVLFNRGMAELFLGHPENARAPLQEALKFLPETNPWHHLGRLYLALCG